MALTQIKTTGITDGAVTGTKIADGAVSSAKLASSVSVSDLTVTASADFTGATVTGLVASVTATGVSFSPTGGVSATNVQAAIAEVDGEKLAIGGGTVTGALVVSGTLRAESGCPANPQAGTSYVLALTDAGGLVELSNAAATTLSIPANAGVPLPVGTQITVVQMGAGTVTVVPAGGVTLLSRGGAVSSAGQYAAMWLYKQAADTWVLAGDIT